MIHILVIDDDLLLTQMISSTLSPTDFRVSCANTATAGIAIVKQEIPDFILLDEIMPDMSGTDVLTLLKSDPDTKTIPVAIYSGYTDTNMQTEAKQLGAIAYLLKTEISPNALEQTIRQLINPTPNSPK